MFDILHKHVNVGSEDNGRCWKFVLRGITPTGTAAVNKLCTRGRGPAHSYEASKSPGVGIWYIFHGPLLLPRFISLLARLNRYVHKINLSR